MVYGMPREAVELGAAEQVLPLPAIAEAMLAARGRRVATADSASGGDTLSRGSPPMAANRS